MASAIPATSGRPLGHSFSVVHRRDDVQTSLKRPSRRHGGSLDSLEQSSAHQPRAEIQDAMQLQSAPSFRVGNVTSNGRLQLRRVPRQTQHSFQSPPSSPLPDSVTTAQPAPVDFDPEWRASLVSDSATSYTASPSTSRILSGSAGNQPEASGQSIASPRLPPTSSPKHSRPRSHSFSTADDHINGEHSTTNGVKILVDKPPPARASFSFDQSLQLLEVNIPHYRLGTPYFSGKGSAILHSSINTSSTTSAPFRSSAISNRNLEQMFPQPPRSRHWSHGNSKAYYPSIDAAASSKRRTMGSNAEAEQLRAAQASSPDPTTLIELEAPPSKHNSRSLVRLSRTTGQIIAATPSGLIAQITSPNLLDYELLSDFFLTFRSYLTTHQLVGFLLARLRWAIGRSDDFGRIVRVRTFVALRHWILNYFVDDFVSDRDLRIEFCNGVNDLCRQLQSRSDGGGGDLNILGELKRCWRRTCTPHWRILEHKSDTAIDDILPGNDYDTAESSADSETPTGAGAQSLEGDSQVNVDQSNRANPSSNIQSSYHARGNGVDRRVSDLSWHVESCSIPFKVGSGSSHKLEDVDSPGPQIARSLPSQSPLSFHVKKNLTQPHNRAASFSDALRDNRIPWSEDPGRRQNLRTSLNRPNFAGSLIRGLIVQPGPPFVESICPETPLDEKKFFDFHPADREEPIYPEDKGAQSNQGMKKLLGSVRRALSTKQVNNPSNMPERRNPATRQSPRTSAVAAPSRPSSHNAYGTSKRHLVGGRAAPRVDVLALSVLEKSRNPDDGKSSENVIPAGSYLKSLEPGPNRINSRIHSSVTNGSRSIVIVDDTGNNTPTPQHPFLQASLPRRSSANSNTAGISPENDFRQTIPIGFENSYFVPRGNSTNIQPKFEAAPLLTEDNLHQPQTTSENPQAANATTLPDENSDEDIEVLPAVSKPIPTPAMSPDLEVLQDTAYPKTPSPEPPPTQITEALMDHQPQLRRRPGGDLRAVDHVHSLEEGYKKQSGTSSESTSKQEVSANVQSTTTTNEELPHAITEETPKPLSILPTHSSQPVLRPSFENEVAKLAQLPDYNDTDDDGGIESTLRKLEGKGVVLKQALPPFTEQNESQTQPQVNGEVDSLAELQSRHHKEDMAQILDDNVNTARKPGEPPKVVGGSFSGSESSIPLLERGISVDMRRPSSTDWLTVSIPQQRKAQPPVGPPDSRPSIDRFQASDANTATVINVPPIPDEPEPTDSPKPTKSFLLDDNQSLDGAYNEPSAANEESKPVSDQTQSFYLDDDGSVHQDSGRLLPHPLRHPDTPPRSKNWPLVSNPKFVAPGPSLAGHISQQDRDAFSAKSVSTKARQSRMDAEVEKPPSPIVTSSITTGSHLPFILAHDSMILAQQFTLIEKDALSEVDWRQLIDLRWNTHAKTFPTWIDCLRLGGNEVEQDNLPGGVDLCITRFNMVVKWAMSEIVLCQDVTERVACIVKYIHLAKCARQLRNWATMFQITMALVNTDISRLKSTWQKVPEREREYLKTLEALITPTRNFHNLREEIDMAVAGIPAPGTDGGCVPFIGIYTHDLIYNAQKSAFAEPSNGLAVEEPLINFERHRIAANIVKNLLRLVDASSKYPFQPVPELLSPCLWLATLEDEEITALSKKLEP